MRTKRYQTHQVWKKWRYDFDHTVELIAMSQRGIHCYLYIPAGKVHTVESTIHYKARGLIKSRGYDKT